MRQGAASQLKQNQQIQSNTQQTQQPQLNLNTSQNVSTSYNITGSKKPQYFPNQQQNSSFHHHPLQNTGESSYQPSKQPSQKSNAQKNHNAHYLQQAQNQNDNNNNIKKQDKGQNGKFHSGNSGQQTSIGASKQKTNNNHGVSNQNQKNVMLQSQMHASQSQNQSINQQLKYSTPTNVGQNQKYLLNQNSRIQSKPKISPKKKKYEMTLRLLEGKIIRDYSTLLWKMSTYLTVELKKGQQQFKTQQLPGKNPKWNESFKFEVNNMGDVVKITLFNKFTFQKEDKLGYLVFSLEKLENYNTTDWFILYDDENQQAGSVLINLTSEEIKVKSGQKNPKDVSDVEQPGSNTDDGDLDENDVDEELEQSLDYRDHEISRSLIPKHHIKGYERSQTRNGGLSGQGIYKGLQTQQQQQSSTSYLHTQANQPRQSVTENSVIRHYSSHSSDNNSEVGVIESPNKGARQQSYYQKDNRQSNYNNTGGLIQRNMNNGEQQQIFNPNFASTNDEEQLLPQQLFYGKSQHQSNSSNNLHGLHHPNQQIQGRYMNPNNASNQQFLYLDDFNNGGAINSSHHHQHKQHCKKSKERSSRRNKKHQHHQKDKSKKQQNIVGVEQFVDEIQQNDEGHEEEDEVNYGNYLNQRSHAQVQQPISASHSQQLLSALAKHHNLNYDSGGATSNSGGQQQLYQLTNMGLSGSGGNGMIVGSNGSYIPSQNIMGPSYFEDQNSIESINDAAIVNHQIISGGPHHHHQMMAKNFYDITELQDIEQAKLQLLEENQIINQQEQQLQQFFAQYNHSKAQLNKDIQMFSEQEKQFTDMKKNFQGQIEEFSKQKKALSAQKKEYKYQKQQLERRFFNMKRERILISQKQKSIDDLYNQFNDLVNSSQILKNQQLIQSIPQKLDEFIGLMKNINYNLQVLNTSDKFQELDRLMQEELIYQHQQQMQGHIQQESTSSCATNSTGNYNFLLQGGHLFNNPNKSPINQNSPYSLQMQQHNKQQQLLSQQFGQSNLGHIGQNNSGLLGGGMNQRGRQNSNNHLQIGSSNLSQSSPKVITDLINTEEEVDFLDQEELFKKHSPRLQDDEIVDEYNSKYNMQQKSGEKQKFFLKNKQGHFLNEQHELSTIMEKELLTSQRRSSNGGAVGTNSMIDNNFKSNQLQQQVMNNTGNQYQMQAQTSSFQLPSHEQQVNKENDDNIMATKLAELEGFKKAYAEKLAYLSGLEQQLLKSTEEKLQLQQLNLSQQQQHQPQIIIQELNQNSNYTSNNFNSHGMLQNDEIVHITASEVPTNHNTSQVMLQQYSTNKLNPVQVQQQLQLISSQQQMQEPITETINNNNLEESMEFIPDPNFLLKINQNMLQNDGKFGQNNNQPPAIKPNNINNINDNNPINPQIFYNNMFGGNDDEESDYYEEDKQVQSNRYQYADNTDPQQQLINIDHEDAFDPNDQNMIMAPNGMMYTQEQLMQMYGGQLDMQMMNQQELMFIEGQQQFFFDQNNMNALPLEEQNQYQDFGEAINEDNDYLQNYDCGGTIMHNNNFTNQQQQPLLISSSQQPSTAPNDIQNQNLSSQNQQSSIEQTTQVKIVPNQISGQQQITIMPRNKKEKLPEEEIQRLIDENYHYDENKELSVIYTEDGRIYDQPKKAKHGIQPIIVKEF